MAAITPLASGYHDDPAKFPGGVLPRDGDTLAIPNGMTITQRAGTSWTIGDPTNPANYAIATAGTNGTGVYAVEPGATLVLKSGVKQGNAAWTIAQGCTIEYDNAAAGVWQISDTNYSNIPRLTIAGAANPGDPASGPPSTTGGNHVVIRSKVGGGRLRFAGGSVYRGGQMDANWCDFARIGTSNVSTDSAYGFEVYPEGSNNFYSWRHCTFDDCGHVGAVQGVGATTIFRFEDNRVLGPGRILRHGLTGAAITTGVRSIQRNYVEGALGSSAGGGSWRDFTIRHNVLLGFLYSSDSAPSWAADSGYNVIRSPGVQSLVVCRTTDRDNPWYLHISTPGSRVDNCRGLGATSAGDLTIGGWVVEPGATDRTGDLITFGPAAAGRVYSIHGVLALPNSTGDHAGQFVSLLGVAGMRLDEVRQCTWPSTVNNVESGAVSYGETYAGHAGIIGGTVADPDKGLIDNLVYNLNGTNAGYVFQRRNIGTVADGCLAANIHHNGKYSLGTGDYGLGYDDTAGTGMFSSGMPGADDVTLTADPFFDSSRRLSSWAVHKGVASSGDTYDAQCTAAYALLGTDPATLIPEMIAWVKAGWAPTNPALQGAAHDGGDIGAVPVVLLSQPGRLAAMGPGSYGLVG